MAAKLLPIAIFVLASIVCRVPAAVGDIGAEIDGILTEEDLAGVTWVVVSPADGITSGAAGYRDNQNMDEMRAGTRVHVGSVAKTVVATGVLRLVTQGRLDLDAPIREVLPDLDVSNPWEGEAEVTIRHLLDHTSGFEDARLWQMFSERPKADTPLIAAFPNPAKLLRVRTLPGARFSYSNMGYGLLGMIIEEATGERYERFLDADLLVPLGMRDSTFTWTTQEGPRADPRLAWGHLDDGTRYPAKPMYLRPAGQFTTTADDLGRLARFLMGDGTINGERFISEQLMRARGRPITTDTAERGLTAGYSLGLARRDRHDVVGYCHTGNIAGYVAALCVYPDEQKAFAYSVNTDSETADYGRISEALIRELDLDPPPIPVTTNAADDFDDWFGNYIPSPSRFHTFRYLDTLFGIIEVKRENHEIVLAALGGSTRVMRPTGPYLFTAADRRTTSHLFLTGADGEYLMTTGFSTLQKTDARYLLALWVSLGCGVAGLTWFLFAGTAVVVRHPRQAIRHPVAPAWMAVIGLFLPLPLFFQQSFMALGDPTPGSLLLAVATACLPLGMMVTIAMVVRAERRSTATLIHGLAATAVLQWCLILAIFGMLPLRLWV